MRRWLAAELLCWNAVKKGLLVMAAIVVGLPIAHISYAMLRTPRVDTGSEAWRHRLDALARAKVFLSGSPSRSDGPDWREPLPDTIECDYVSRETSGTTPKFDCRLPSGEVVKVKYGVNPEIHAEVAATKLLTALGFAADDVSIAGRVRCRGCTRSPFRMRQVAEWYFVDGLFERFLDYAAYADFTNVAIERRLPWRAVEAGDTEGFGFYELPLVDAARGGASAGELDALRLIAVFLAHWDNKSSNQRIVCLGERAQDPAAACAAPLLMIQDAGATFGPRKVDYDGWNAEPVWHSKDICLVSMADMPFDGATFTDAVISEEGRRLLAERFSRLTEAQITALFQTARFPDARTGEPAAQDVTPWVRTFQRKVGEITSRDCAPSPSR